MIASEDPNNNFPWVEWSSIAFLAADSRDAFDKAFQGNKQMFYCPNINEGGFWATPTNWNDAVWIKIGYYYLANPRSSSASGPINDTYWIDLNGNGTKTDEYLVTLKDPHPADVPICVDATGTPPSPYPANWYYPHPPGFGKGSINVLYGDGHVTAKMANDLKKSWGSALYGAGW